MIEPPIAWHRVHPNVLFSGDAGATEASRASHRYGIEVPIYYRPTDRVTLDFEIAFTHSRYSQDDPVGSFIPGAINQVYAAGVTVQNPRGSSARYAFATSALVRSSRTRA